MQPVFVPIKSGVERSSEDSIMEENLETTDNTEDMVNGEFKMKKIITKEASVASFFERAKAESDFEKISHENVLEEDSQAGKSAEVLVSQASFLVKEEPIDCEETWQDHVKLEHACSLSMNSQSDGSDKSNKDGVDVKNVLPTAIAQRSVRRQKKNTKRTIEDIVKEEALSEELTTPCFINVEEHDVFEENNWQLHDDYSTLPCCSQPVSATLSLSEMEGTDPQTLFGRCSSSSSNKTVQLPSFACQNILPAASCSTQGITVGQEKSADTYLWKMQVEQQEATARQKQQSGQFRDRISTNIEGKHSQGEMLLLGSTRSSTGEGFFKCGHCGKDFKKKGNLVVHVRIHTGERPYKCSQCGKSFTEGRKLKNHMRTHSGDQPFKCSECGKSYTVKGSLTNHMRTHSGDRPYKCSQCGKSFTRNSTLTIHMRTHSGDCPFKCSQCGKSFTEGRKLKNHMRTHSGVRPYKCSQCGKSFTERGSLTNHMRTHSDDRPYKCSQCAISFKLNWNLTVHIRKHTGDRPYKCSQCGKSFTVSSHLTNHMRTHSGDRPYKCSQCGKSFTSSSTLIRHLRRHINDQP